MRRENLIWSWSSDLDLRALPLWVEKCLLIIGLPVVVILTYIAVVPAFSSINEIAILLAITIFVVPWLRKISTDDQTENYLHLKIYRDRIFFKYSIHKHTIKLEDINLDSFSIERKGYPSRLTFEDTRKNRMISIPLIGMSKSTKKKMTDILMAL